MLPTETEWRNIQRRAQSIDEDLRKNVINKERQYENIVVRVNGKKKHTKRILKSISK